MSAPWFSVDKEGLAKLVERRGKAFVVYELLQNALDTNAKVVTVDLAPVSGKPFARLRVVDDAPDGFKDLAHAYTLFAESEKKIDPEKRGRFNLGEKLVLALCSWAEIVTTTGGVRFDAEGRHALRRKRPAGSEFTAELRMTREEFDEVQRTVLREIIVSGTVDFTFNGTLVRPRVPLRSFVVTLPTDVSNADGYLRRVQRQTKVLAYRPWDGEPARLYELGIPVCETGDTWSLNVMQKVPLNMDRDGVSASYLRTLRTAALNALVDALPAEEARQPWVQQALEHESIDNQTVRDVLAKQYGKLRVIADPSDPEGTKIATSRGYTVIPGGAFSGAAWENIRRADAALPAGQVTPSPKPYGAGGEELKLVPFDKWTDDVRAVVDYARRIGKAILRHDILVRIANDIEWPFSATFGKSGTLTLNLGRLGHAWFRADNTDAVNELLIHEFAHGNVSDHLSSEFHEECCRLGALLVRLALAEPETFKLVRS